MKVLLLEDDALFAETLVDFLDDEGFDVVHAINGEVALELTYREKFDIYLLDINVPLIDGISLLKDLRQADDTTPAIYVTSHSDKSILEKAFSAGCDDYMKKPFDLDELLWRMNAKVKKRVTTKSLKKFQIDEHEIVYAGTPLALSVSEYKVLKLLLLNQDEVVTKEMIENELWSASKAQSSGAIRVYITRIKQLIPPEHIENIRGVGYKFVSELSS